MHDGREPGPDDVVLDLDQPRENTERPSDVADQADEVALPGGEMPGADEADGTEGVRPEAEDVPEEEQSPT